jgi:tetratricopeptide (TPR) repeat protein
MPIELRIKPLTTAVTLIAAAMFFASAPASRAQQSSQTPQPQQGDSSQPPAPNQGNPQDGPLPPSPAPDKPSAQPPRSSNSDGPQWSSSKKADTGPDDVDDSSSSSKSKKSPDASDAPASADSDSQDAGKKPPVSKAKPGVLPPETDPAWDPFHAQQDIDVGKFYMDKGDYDAAITRFEDAIRLRANFAKPRAMLAEAYEKKGDKEEALRYYKEYLQVLPNAADAKKIQKKIDQLSSK